MASAAAPKRFLSLVFATFFLLLFITKWAVPYGRNPSTTQLTAAEEETISSSSSSANQDPFERCVTLAFDHPSQAPAPALALATDKGLLLNWDSVLCKDLFRIVDVHYRVHGFLPSYYVKALEKAPRFKNDESALNEFLCRLDPNNNYRGVPCYS